MPEPLGLLLFTSWLVLLAWGRWLLLSPDLARLAAAPDEAPVILGEETLPARMIGLPVDSAAPAGLELDFLPLALRVGIRARGNGQCVTQRLKCRRATDFYGPRLSPFSSTVCCSYGC